jgi:hypothetical protein
MCWTALEDLSGFVRKTKCRYRNGLLKLVTTDRVPGNLLRDMSKQRETSGN